jgi:predicted RNA-binding protein with PUA-like domain
VYLLLRQHVSALALGHYQVSNCASEETIQCSIGVAHVILHDFVDNVTFDPRQEYNNNNNNNNNIY